MEPVRDFLNKNAPKAGRHPNGRRKTVGVEIHLHFNGPIIVGSEVATILLPVLLQVTEIPSPRGK